MDCTSVPHSQSGDGYCSGNILLRCIRRRVWFSTSLWNLVSAILDMLLLKDFVDGCGRCWWLFRVRSILFFHLLTALDFSEFFASVRLRVDLKSPFEAKVAALFASLSARSFPVRSVYPGTHFNWTLWPLVWRFSTACWILICSSVNS